MRTDEKTEKKSNAKIWVIVGVAVVACFYFFGGDDGKPTPGHYRSRGQTPNVDYRRQPNRLTARQIQQLRQAQQLRQRQQAYQLQQAYWRQQQLQGAIAVRRMQALQQQRQMMQGSGGFINRGQGGTYGTDGKDFYISFGDGSSYMGR